VSIPGVGVRRAGLRNRPCRWPHGAAEGEIIALPQKTDSYHLLALVGLAAIIGIMLRVGPFN